MTPTHIIRETIENHLGDLCPVSDSDISEVVDLMGGDVTAITVEEAFEEVTGSMGWDERLFEDIASALLEESVGLPA